jgi:hypothetical protein
MFVIRKSVAANFCVRNRLDIAVMPDQTGLATIINADF